MAELIVAEQLAAYLIAQGLVADYDDAVSATLPSIWIRPRDGAADPREIHGGGHEAGAVTLATVTTGRAPKAPWVELCLVDVIVRTHDERDGQLLQRAVRDLLAPLDQIDGRKQWLMGELLVERSDLFTPEQAIGVSDVSYDSSQVFQFFCRRKALAGTPSTP